MGNSQSGIPAETNEEERGETRKAEGLGTVLSHDRSVAEEEGTPATGGATSGEQHDGMAHHIDEEHSRMNTFITEDQVQVNLAMADLMAYLQVVANNSTNLPLTRRDDSEMQKVVANITSEEYACKAAAFIPADVRVIGGSFTRYGRVWDLPTMEVSYCLLACRISAEKIERTGNTHSLFEGVHCYRWGSRAGAFLRWSMLKYLPQGTLRRSYRKTNGEEPRKRN